jgi:hypothetical protein
VIACLAVGCGVYVGMHTGARPSRLTPRIRRALLPWFYASCLLTLFGYAAWTVSGVRNGLSIELIRSLLDGSDPESSPDLKFDVLVTIPGITTCTQFGLLAVQLGMVLSGRKNRTVGLLTAAIVLLAGLRMFMFSERLALIEVVVAMALAWLRIRVLGRKGTRRWQFALSVLPIAGFAAVLVLFGTAEFFRSWKYYQNEMDSLVDFTLMRFFGYYSTSHNNGAMAWQMDHNLSVPFHTMQWYWNFPLLGKTPLSYQSVTGVDPVWEYTRLLNRYGNAEFNNEGGLFAPTLDFGVLGGLAFWLGFGFLAGRLYTSYLAGALAGLLLYPFFVICILEVPRFVYLCTVRPFAPLVMTMLILYCVVPRAGVAHGH